MNCLRFMVSTWRTKAKCSGANVGMPSNRNFFPGTLMVSPMEKMPGVKNANDVARIGLVYNLALLRHELLGLGKLHPLIPLHMQHLHALFKLPGADGA